MSLDQKYVIKAQNELNETADVRSQSLKDFRLWIAQHVYFANCRQDDTFLLQFLRTKKFRLDKSTELFENYMLLKHSVPRWYDFTDDVFSRVWALYESKVAYPLMERDKEGRRVIYVQARNVDHKVFTATDCIQLLTWIARVILEEEETQISGIVTVIDQSNITFGHLRLFSVKDAIDFVSVIKQGSVGRQKGMYIVALPSFASFMLEVAKKATNEKLKKRIHVVENMEKLMTLLDPSLFPKELGGLVPESEMMENFKKVALERNDLLRSIQDGVDWDRVELDGENSACSLM